MRTNPVVVVTGASTGLGRHCPCTSTKKRQTGITCAQSHAASFALIAYASAYFKVKYLAAFTTAILNNQPMGFYAPAVLVKDAQRHGLRIKPIDVQVSDWACTIEHQSDGSLSLRMGLGYAKGLRRQSAELLSSTRATAGPFCSAEDLALRVPSLNRKELTLLARIGALNNLDGVTHRRDALWQVERAGKLEGPLLRQESEWLREDSASLPLRQMNQLLWIDPCLLECQSMFLQRQVQRCEPQYGAAR